MKITSLLVTGIAFTALALAATGNRQVTKNNLSPSADTSIKLGKDSITVEYNAPSGRGRKIEGGLIPYNEWYRLGADAATTITTTAPITIGTLAVPKGVHTLFLFATPTGWQLIVNKEKGQWGLDYKPAQDLGRTPMELTKLDSPVEKFNITLKATGDKTGTLEVTWGTTKASVAIKAE